MTEMKQNINISENVDPFTYEIIKNGLNTAAEEMFYAFGRAARSPVIYETLDYASAITDKNGDLIAQANGVPGFLGVLDYAVRDLIASREDILDEFYIANIPYFGGTHLNDVTIILPVFHQGTIDMYIVNKGHWSEIGGMRFGSWSPDATEIFQEGLQMPNVKLTTNGVPDKEIIEIIKANSRTPDLMIGDMEAQIASMRIARNRILEMYSRYGRGNVLKTISKLKDVSERKSYGYLKNLPHGEFKIEDFIDDDGINDEPIKVKLKLTITDDSFVADFTGSSKAVIGSINSPLPATVSAVRMVYVATTDPHSDPNEGTFAPIKIIAPEGSIFNPRRPTPTSTYWESMSYASDLVWHALVTRLPQKLSAGHFLTVGATIIGGNDDLNGNGTPFAIVEPQPGGWGARNDSDGENVLVCSGDGETFAQSAEVIEKTLPIRVEQLSLNLHDGFSKGKFRGGFGMIKEYRILCSEASFSGSFGRSRFTSWGVEDGENGTPNYFEIFGSREMKGRRIGGLKLHKNDLISIHTGCGGAWGKYEDRDPKLIELDIKNGYIKQSNI